MRTLILVLTLAYAASAADSIDRIRQNFADPPSEYRSMPLWVWNDELQWPRLQEQLRQFHQQGIGGVFVHPRPGLMTEYLGPEWFRLWGLSIEEGKRLGMKVNIYDENSYPSGFAGGHVPSLAPDTASQFVEMAAGVPRDRIPWNAAETVAVFAGVRRIERASDFPEDTTATVFRLRRASGNPWTAGFPYVDLTNPETAPNFIATTFDAYKKHFGAEFGNTVRWVFDDEPLLATGGAYDSAPLALPLSRNTLAEFHKRTGYDLADHLPSLYQDVEEFRKVRFDYWQTLHDLWKENYFQPIYQWCERNGIGFTGHWMEHEWPYPWISPDDASMYAFESMPGIDMLEGTNIRTKGSDPHMLFTIKQVASVANQLGRRAFCEAYGVAGWDSTFEHYKRFGDWLMVHGIDFMNQHLAFSTVRGARKRDHPQSFTDVSPWWPYYRMHGDHLGRVSYMMAQGRPHNRVVILEPTTSGFLFARRGGTTPELETMRRDNAEMIQYLADHQMDFDLLDEYILEWYGGVEGKRLKVSKASYDLLVWPKNMVNVRRETLPKLEQYLAAGGEIVALAPPAEYVDGRPNRAVRSLRDRYTRQWRTVKDVPALVAEIERRLKPRFRFEPALPDDVGAGERILDSGDRIVFFANTGLGVVRSKVTVEGGAVEHWDTATGKIAAIDGPTFDLELAPAGSQLLVIRKAAEAPARTPSVRFTKIDTGRWQVRADTKNVLPLDYCDISMPGLELKNVNTWEANWKLWQAHGFERPAWDNAVQFKTRVYDRNHFAKDSGFDATFHFEVEGEAVLKGLELAMETPELYRVLVNGQPVSFENGSRWLDPHIRSVAIATLAHIGSNAVSVSAHPFEVRMEFENIYLRGDFTVKASDAGFRISDPQPLEFGAWSGQGRPFYADAVTYSTDIVVPAGANRLKVEFPKWQGSVAVMLLDGKQMATVGWQPWSAEFPAAAGKHTLAVRVVSTPRNTFGPFHNPTKPRMRAWPAAWADFPKHQPPGTGYDVLEYGLMEAPAVSAGTLR